MKILETERLVLRTWEDQDLKDILAMNQDPKVMQYFPSLQDLEATKCLMNKVEQHFAEYGYSLYAAIRKDTEEFIGFIGLFKTQFKAHFTPATEIGWRLLSEQWGKGFAVEGAKAVLKYAFEELKLPEIVSFTSQKNKRSIRLMQKIGLERDEKDDFDFPDMPADNPLKRHVLYRLTRDDYLSASK